MKMVSGRFSRRSTSVFLQFKPGVVMDVDLCQEVLDRFDAAMPRARQLLKSRRKAA